MGRGGQSTKLGDAEIGSGTEAGLLRSKEGEVIGGGAGITALIGFLEIGKAGAGIEEGRCRGESGFFKSKSGFFEIKRRGIVGGFAKEGSIFGTIPGEEKAKAGSGFGGLRSEGRVAFIGFPKIRKIQADETGGQNCSRFRIWFDIAFTGLFESSRLCLRVEGLLRR
ncbi:MAG: hypothetical protein LBD54_02285 [Puniceicoccales bacterium]|jgi:hypothetical protein|nr:hypothetical protein [Puniceicoccales bacterium]